MAGSPAARAETKISPDDFIRHLETFDVKRLSFIEARIKSEFRVRSKQSIYPVLKLPIQIGPGRMDDDKDSTPSIKNINRNMQSAKKFVDDYLKPCGASFIVATGGLFEAFPDYFGGSQLEQRDRYSFWKPSGDPKIKWFSFQEKNQINSLLLFLSVQIQLRFIISRYSMERHFTMRHMFYIEKLEMEALLNITSVQMTAPKHYMI